MEPSSRLEATATMTASTSPLETPETLDPNSLVDNSETVADVLPAVGFDPFSLLLNLLGGNETTAAFFTTNGLTDFIGTLWNIYVFFALLVSVGLLIMYTYASMWRWFYYGDANRQLREAEDLYDAQFRGIHKSSRLDDIQAHVASDNPNDWKLAIIEADIILDGLLKDRGYAGNTLGERLRSISVNQLGSLQDAWEAHKIRNMIAHEGPDFVLTKRMAEDTVKRYLRVFAEFGLD